MYSRFSGQSTDHQFETMSCLLSPPITKYHIPNQNGPRMGCCQATLPITSSQTGWVHSSIAIPNTFLSQHEYLHKTHSRAISLLLHEPETPNLNYASDYFFFDSETLYTHMHAGSNGQLVYFPAYIDPARIQRFLFLIRDTTPLSFGLFTMGFLELLGPLFQAAAEFLAVDEVPRGGVRGWALSDNFLGQLEWIWVG